MKKLMTLLLVGICVSAYAEEAEIYQPMQRPYPQQWPALLSEKGRDASDLIDTIKVKIFPHDGKYTTPQGAETRMDQVIVKTSGTCEFKMGSIVTVAKEFALKASDFSLTAGYMSCDAPLTLVREGAKAHTYRGSFSFHKEKDKLIVVNYVSLKNYLKGVVPTEVFASWPLETLKAQAVAARTYAVNQVLFERNAHPARVYEVDDTVMYQAYLGFSREHPATSKAVELTEGEYITDSAGKVITAYFSADSGGYTEAAVNVWGVDLAYTVSKPEVYDLTLVNSKWSREFSTSEIEQKLIAKKLIPKDFQLVDFEVIETTVSGRMKKVKIFGINGNEKIVTGENFRYGLSLKSSLVTFTKLDNGNYQLDGLGFGHGVGMCQYGAKVLAKHMGWDYKQILNFYYDGVNF